jgi:hypothetical protein
MCIDFDFNKIILFQVIVNKFVKTFIIGKSNKKFIVKNYLTKINDSNLHYFEFEKIKLKNKKFI